MPMLPLIFGLFIILYLEFGLCVCHITLNHIFCPNLLSDPGSRDCVLEPVESLSFSTFLFLNKAPGTRTSVEEISQSFDAHTLEITHRHMHKTERTSTQKAYTLRDGLCTLPLKSP
jgi:hypothetical protein